jgi:hypothetical protein
MDAMEVQESADSTDLRIVLGRPVRVLGHAPRGRTRLIEIRVQPGAAPRSDGETMRDEERLRVPPGVSGWLRDVRLEPQTGGTGMIVVEFVDPVDYVLRSEGGGTAVVLRVRKESGKNAAGPPPVARTGDPDELLEEAARAMRDGAYPRAIALYTKLVEMPEGPWSATALEYLGLARQKNGQRAHARAEYELYLLRYPDGDGSERVRQRLEALRTARQPRRTTLVPAPTRNETELDGYGTFSTSYQRVESFADLSGAVLADSSQIFEGDVTGLARRGDWDARLRASGYYRYDYTERDTGRGSRVRYLSLEMRNRTLRSRGVVGRQPGRGGGVLGRFDGLRLDVGLGDAIRVGGVFGFPQVSSIDDGLDTSRMLGGVRIGAERIFDRLDGEAYVIGQSADGLVDRVGIGGELRYAGRLGSVLVGLDFDAYYASLNLASLSASIGLTRTTWLNVHADRRNAPFLTTRNALIGRPESSLSALEIGFTDGQIEDLARDRTAQISSVTVGVEQQIGEDWRLVADVGGMAMSGTPASGGVAAMPATGWEFSYLLQAIGQDSLMEGDSVRASLRIFDGRLYTGYTLFASARYPLPHGFRITPLLVVDYRDQRVTRDVLTLRPGLQAQYRYRMLTFEADVRGEWLRGVGSGPARPASQQTGYVLFVSIRLDI